MKLIKKISIFTTLALLSGLMFSCKDDAPLHEKEYSEKHAYTENIISSEYDSVQSYYDGSVAMLHVNSEDLAPYFQKRMSNVTSTITPETDVVMLSEIGAMSALSNANVFKSLQEHWNNNKPVGFVYPSENVLKLLAKLQGFDKNNVDAKEVKSIRQYAVYMLRSDGNAVSYINPRFAERTTQYIDSNGVEHETKKLLTQSIEVSEGTKGRMAERTVEWLNKKPAFQGGYGDILYEPFTHKTYIPITVDHNSWVEDYEYGTGCGTSTTEAVIELKVYAGYDKANKQDVYNVIISEVFDANKSYLEDQIVRKYAAYKNKYTGGNYAGVRVGLEICSVDKRDVSFMDAIPIASAGSYSETFTPTSITVGGDISGNICANITPPATTVSMTYSELPVQYNDNHDWVEWDFGIKELKHYPHVYDSMWGFNPGFINVFGFSKSSCQTQQAVTFKVKTDERFEGNETLLAVETMFKTYHEVASPFSTVQGYDFYRNLFFVNLPTVCRHFEKYSPYCYAQKVNDNTETWLSVESTLKDNVNYKMFYNDNLEIGSPIKNGVDKEASMIWAETIKSIITQFSARNFKNEYVVALADSKGTPLKAGLYITSNGWKLVSDITQVRL